MAGRLAVQANWADHPTEEKAIGEAAAADEKLFTLESREEKKRRLYRMRIERYRVQRVATLLAERELRRHQGLSVASDAEDDDSFGLPELVVDKENLLVPLSSSILADDFLVTCLGTGKGEGDAEQQFIIASSLGPQGESSKKQSASAQMEIGSSSSPPDSSTSALVDGSGKV